MATCPDCGGPKVRASSKRCQPCQRRHLHIDPAIRAKRAASNKLFAAANSERYRAMALAMHAKRVAWCPAEYRQQYHALKRDKTFRAAEVRAMILAQIAADKRRAIPPKPKPMTFEQQLAAVEAGATVVDKLRVPGKQYGGTMGGVSAGELG